MSLGSSISGVGVPEPVSSETVFQTEWFSLRKETFEASVCSNKPYYTVDGGDGCFVIPFTPEGQLILIRQFRPSVGQFTIEMPAGAVDGDENPRDAAARELLEETGYEPEFLSPIGSGHMMMNRFSGRLYAFIGKNCRLQGKPTHGEHTEVVLVRWPDFLEKVLSGEFTQMGGLGFLHLAQLKGLLPSLA
jgi:8-oxo-dGTP pyrophosphatase MutT (NUDIX family)